MNMIISFKIAMMQHNKDSFNLPKVISNQNMVRKTHMNTKNN